MSARLKIPVPKTIFDGLKPLKICIGYDSKESITWHVLAHSIMARSSGPIQIIPINLRNLTGIFTRPRDAGQSTDFTYARFLAPYLCGWEPCVFMDSDMLVRCDIWELEKLARENPYVDVLCVKHDYKPREGKKFLGNTQTQYPCKNWSSLMIFNGHRAAVRKLTPEFVNNASPMALHQFHWATDVGEIPAEYNHLVGEYACNPGAKIVHFTLGAPCFRSYQTCEYSEEWFEELGRMTHCDDPILELHDADLSRRDAANRSRPVKQDGPEPGDWAGD